MHTESFQRITDWVNGKESVHEDSTLLLQTWDGGEGIAFLAVFESQIRT